LLGCGKSEDKYIGTYVNEKTQYYSRELELKRDGTYRYEFGGDDKIEGEWTKKKIMAMNI
jgi:hypothetical protein